MANIDEQFPGKYLRAHDIPANAEPVVTISHSEVEIIGKNQADKKIVVYFKGKSKGLALNKTNANSIAEICGSRDTDDWPGHNLKLIVVKVEFQGTRVPAIRIESAGRQKPVAPEPPVSVDADDISF